MNSNSKPAILTKPTSATMETKRTIKVPMPGTPCSDYGCQKDDVGVCVHCGRIRPWLERPPGYPLGGKMYQTKHAEKLGQLLIDVDEILDGKTSKAQDDEGDEEIREGVEKLYGFGRT
ncbi:uncharacterized protein PAC_09416 [Phialocephala subalpina]|uniref:Uncharacterized protein n=1 Tax=Phialocephala subalpina TaxID=576137 RepID=A0A1L7X3B6_9HELO|nr:uncharacterized protein PAC_09416 [Phialocephala subalpina]